MTTQREAYHRQRRQRGLSKVHAHREYMKHRSQNKLRAKKRYRKMRHNPAFKRRQHLYQKNPSRFKRLAGMGGFTPILFWSDALGLGSVIGTDGCDVFYQLADAEEDLFALSYQDLLDTMVFFDDESIDRFFDMLDAATDTPDVVRAVSNAMVQAVEDDQ